MMNRTWRSVFSILLAVALLLPMAPAAHADGEAVAAERVELSSNVSGNKIYYRSDEYNGQITITAIVTPSAYTGKIQWELSRNAPLSVVSEDTTVSGGQAKITLKALPTSSVGAFSDKPTVTAVLDSALLDGKVETNKVRSDPFVIEVAKDAVDMTSLAFTQNAVSVQVGKTVQLSFNKTPITYPSGFGTPTVTYESDNPAVATVDANGKVTGKSEGGATISAKIDGAKVDNSVSVSVLSASTALTGNATIGTHFSMQNIYEDLLLQFSDTFGGKKPTKVRFPGLGTPNATLCNKGGEAIISGGLYEFSQLRDMYLDPTAQGTFKCEIVATDGTNNLTGNIAVTIGVPTKTIRIPLSGSSNYTFYEPSADPAGKSGAAIIKEAIGTFGSLQFGAVEADGSNTGTLYVTSSASNANRVGLGTVVSANDIDGLYFTPSRSGTYKIPYTAYYSAGGYGSVACTGELILPVDGTSLDITLNLDSLKPYTFSQTPASSTVSAYALLLTAINGSVGGSTWGGIKFDGAASASATGTLQRGSEYSRAVSASDYIAKSSMSTLYYVPNQPGKYSIVYGIYTSEESDKPIATGTLTIVTSTIPAGSSDITYTTSVNNSVTLNENDFLSFFQKENGGRYQLSYIVFKEYNGDGTFYHGTSTFVPYNSADFYSATYTGEIPANAHYLSKLSFKAPAASGCTVVAFTCYGGTTSNSTAKATSGKLSIFYTANNVPDVVYNVNGAAVTDLREADFVTSYNAAMKSSVSKPQFRIQILTTPSKGTLYYYSGKTAKELTSANIANYTFTVNDSSGVSVENLSYSAERSALGSDSINYTVTSASGTMLYVGKLVFKLSSDISLNVTNDGANFQLSDFYAASDSDPVAYVTFSKPSTGKIYTYTGDRYIEVPSETRFYTASALDGRYPITDAFYAPKANEAGSVSLNCALHRKSGATNTMSITVNVLSKTSSGSFGDVGGVTGWASNSIDFAARMGLVNGTQKNPPLFSPSNTMRRCDFVLMLYRLAGSPTQSATGVFPDVTSDKYYYSSAIWAYRNDIMRNVTVNGKYDPDGALTRQDFAQILFNYTNAMGEKNTSNSGSIRGYADASKVSSNTVEGVTWAVANGYITSAVVGQLYIEPQRDATRAEISTLLHRYLTY